MGSRSGRVLVGSLVCAGVSGGAQAGPLLLTSTYIGGSERDRFVAVGLDGAGHIYAAGESASVDFPWKDGLPIPSASGDCVVVKLSPDGGAIVYSTYLGGSAGDGCNDIAVYAVGVTTSTDFPIARPLQAAIGGRSDGFVAKIVPGGAALDYSTYLGGAELDSLQGLAIDGAGAAYIVGSTGSDDYPTSRPLQGTKGSPGFPSADASIGKLSADGASLLYSTFLGGSEEDWGRDIAVDPSGLVTVVGATKSVDFPTVNELQGHHGYFDAFVARLQSDGSALVYSTYLGGRGEEVAYSVVLDATGGAYAVGITESIDYPVLDPLQARSAGVPDGFIFRISSVGQLLASSYLGGPGGEVFWSVARNDCGDIVVGGLSTSAGYPLLDALQVHGGLADSVVTVLDPDISAIRFSTYLGGSAPDGEARLAVDRSGGIVVVGSTESSDFPIRAALQPVHAGEADAYVVRIDACVCAAVPGSLGNALHAVRDPARTSVTFSWASLPAATGYNLYRDPVKSGPFVDLAGSSSGATVIAIPYPSEPLLSYRLAATSCAGEGPK